MRVGLVEATSMPRDTVLPPIPLHVPVSRKKRRFAGLLFVTRPIRVSKLR